MQLLTEGDATLHEPIHFSRASEACDVRSFPRQKRSYLWRMPHTWVGLACGTGRDDELMQVRTLAPCVVRLCLQVEVALQWSNTSTENMISFVNCIRTVDGGTHLDGAKQAVTRIINKLAKEKNLVKDVSGSLLGEHVREGLTAVRPCPPPTACPLPNARSRMRSPQPPCCASYADSIHTHTHTHTHTTNRASCAHHVPVLANRPLARVQIVSVKVPEPEFEGQTKTRLGNPEVKTASQRLVADLLEEHLRVHASTLKAIVDKAALAQKAADAAKRARDMVRRKTVLTKSTLPGKLADCTATAGETEIFIVEGDSAGGSAKQVRQHACAD